MGHVVLGNSSAPRKPNERAKYAKKQSVSKAGRKMWPSQLLQTCEPQTATLYSYISLCLRRGLAHCCWKSDELVCLSGTEEASRATKQCNHGKKGQHATALEGRRMLHRSSRTWWVLQGKDVRNCVSEQIGHVTVLPILTQSLLGALHGSVNCLLSWAHPSDARIPSCVSGRKRSFCHLSKLKFTRQ